MGRWMFATKANMLKFAWNRREKDWRDASFQIGLQTCPESALGLRMNVLTGSASKEARFWPFPRILIGQCLKKF